jgi:hypothetical protein
LAFDPAAAAGAGFGQVQFVDQLVCVIRWWSVLVELFDQHGGEVGQLVGAVQSGQVGQRRFDTSPGARVQPSGGVAAQCPFDHFGVCPVDLPTT